MDQRTFSMEVSDVSNIEHIIDMLMNRASQIDDVLDRERQLANAGNHPMSRPSGACTGRSTTFASRVETTTEAAPRPLTARVGYSNIKQMKSTDVSCDSSILIVSEPIPSLNSSITRSLSQDSVAESKLQTSSMAQSQTSRTKLSIVKRANDNEFYFPPARWEKHDRPIMSPLLFDGYKDYPVIVKNGNTSYTGLSKVRISRVSSNPWLSVHFVIMDNNGVVLLDLKTELLGTETRNIVVNGVPAP